MKNKLFTNKENVLSILESSYDGIYITDKDGMTLYVNHAYETLSGCDRSLYVGKYMSDLMESGQMKTHITKDVVATKKSITVTEQLISGKSVLITGNPIFDDDGDVIAVVTNIRDISEILALQKKERISEELIALYKKQYFNAADLEDIVCESPGTVAVFNIAQKVSERDSTVLLTGETGTGKEVVAKYIHYHSPRKKKNYIKINCGAIPPTLLESELFGYAPGAFSGADPKGKPGLFEIADQGTLFLDEIGELPMELQSALLRVLQDGEITRIGATTSQRVDVRIIAATNRNLIDMISKGTFRADLYYRLDVVSIHLPPLRERHEDIPALAELFIKKLNQKYNSHKEASHTFLLELMTKKWPGNIRELSNFIERQFVMSDENVINSVQHIVLNSENSDGSNELADVTLPTADRYNMKKVVTSIEVSMIKSALQSCKNTSEAAKMLGISQPTFSRKYNNYKDQGLL